MFSLLLLIMILHFCWLKPWPNSPCAIWLTCSRLLWRSSFNSRSRWTSICSRRKNSKTSSPKDPKAKPALNVKPADSWDYGCQSNIANNKVGETMLLNWCWQSLPTIKLDIQPTIQEIILISTGYPTNKVTWIPAHLLAHGIPAIVPATTQERQQLVLPAACPWSLAHQPRPCLCQRSLARPASRSAPYRLVPSPEWNCSGRWTIRLVIECCVA